MSTHDTRDTRIGRGRDSPSRNGRQSLLSISLFAIAGGVLAQALLAGLFLSGVGDARLVHAIVGAVVPYVAIVPVVSAWRGSRDGCVTRGVATGATVLLIGLWVQEALGHMPLPITTAIHVPLGVLLFALALLLGMRTLASGTVGEVDHHRRRGTAR